MKYDPLIADVKSTKRHAQALFIFEAALEISHSKGVPCRDGYTPHVWFLKGKIDIFQQAWQNAVPSAKKPYEWNVDDKDIQRRSCIEICFEDRKVFRVVSSEFSGTVVELFRRGPWEKQLLALAEHKQDSNKPQRAPVAPVANPTAPDRSDFDDDFED